MKQSNDCWCHVVAPCPSCRAAMNNKLAPCLCCHYRTELSVCRNSAIKENWESIKKISELFYKEVKNK
jgi:hypothetical protein